MKIEIPVIKAKKMIEVDINKLPEEVLYGIYFLGIKHIINRGALIVKTKEEALKQAEENYQLLLKGNLRLVKYKY